MRGLFPAEKQHPPEGRRLGHPGRIADEGADVPRGGDGLEVSQPGGGVQQAGGGEAEREGVPEASASSCSGA